MSADCTPARYPRRQRKPVNYKIDQDANDQPLNDAVFSEKTSENVVLAPVLQPLTSSSAAKRVDNDEEESSEDNDATYGSRKTKKRKVSMARKKTRSKLRRLPQWKPFRLMALPAELRMKIYREALVDPYGVHIRTYDDRYEKFAVHVSAKKSRPNQRVWNDLHKGYVNGEWLPIDRHQLPESRYQLSPNLLAASKTIYQEASAFLWTQTFIFSDIHGLYALLSMLRPQTISRLEDITILKRGWITGRKLQAFTLLRDAVNLRNLRFDCKIQSEMGSRYDNISDFVLGQRIADRLYKDCHPFLKAFVSHRGISALVDVLKFDDEDFVVRVFNYGTNGFIRLGRTEERERRVLQSLFAQMEQILNRKISPKFSGPS